LSIYVDQIRECVTWALDYALDGRWRNCWYNC